MRDYDVDSVIMDSSSDNDTSHGSSDDSWQPFSWSPRDDPMPGSISKFEPHICVFCGDVSFINGSDITPFLMCGECELQRRVARTPCIFFKQLVDKKGIPDICLDAVVSFLLPEDSFVAFRRAYLRKMLMGYHQLSMYLWDADGIWGAMHKNTPFVT